MVTNINICNDILIFITQLLLSARDPDNGSVFHVNTFYANYMKLSDALINPILVFIVQYLLEIMFWTKPWLENLFFVLLKAQ